MVSSGEPVEIEKPQQEDLNSENGSSSDGENDAIQKLKAENRLEDSENNQVNGDYKDLVKEQENGADKDDETESVTEISNGEKENENEEEVVTLEEDIVEEESPNNGSENEMEQDADSDIEEIVNEEDSTASTSQTNGTSKENGKRSSEDVECIDLEDDEETKKKDSDQPPAKKSKKESEDDVEVVTQSKEDKEKEYEEGAERVFANLQDYVLNAVESNNSVNRKLLDTLLAAINQQVQKEPYVVRKIILDKRLVLPNTISIPPSQVVDFLIEHDPEFPLTKVITKMFGEDRPKLTDLEKRERANLKQNNPVPNMTKLLIDIGQDLAQESTYCDIVHAKNLPEVPKNVDTYKQVAQQLKPVWETLKRKNEPYKMKLKRCSICGFQTESNLVMSRHKATLHTVGGKYQCAMCKEIESNEQRMIEHYFESHLVVAIPEEKEAKYPCVICDEDFNFKGVREQHYKQCKRDYIRIRHIMIPKPDDFLYINRWLWEKPPMDPSILQQQQAAQQAQLKKQQQQQAAAQHLQALKRQQQQAILQQQQQQQLIQQQNQSKLRQMAQILQSAQGRGNMLNNTSLLAAMQAQLRRGSSSPNTNVGAAASLLQKQMASLAKGSGGSAAMQAAVAAAAKNQKTPASVKLQKLFGVGQQSQALPSPSAIAALQCEICDQNIADKERYLQHLQGTHREMTNKSVGDLSQGAPLACSRCRDRFWTYEGLERHLVMSHGLVTADLLQKAQRKEDGGRCRLCSKQYAFNMLQHLVSDHQVKLCSAEIMYSCDVCSFKCKSYQILEVHLTQQHPKESAEKKKKEDCITLDD